ncbi:MAG: family 78 glycoside hydrolase catalytic domain [Bryobacteraceae bacterium]
MKNFLVPVLVCFAGALASADAGGSVRPAKLRCEYRVNPLGIDEREPRLSWILVSLKPGARGLRQNAYRIQAASSEANVSTGKADLWDSGKVNASDSNQIVYSGKPLQSRQRVFWRVRVWDQDGHASEWSEMAQWSMGLLSADDWKGKWIGANEESSFENPESAYQHLKAAHWISAAAAEGGKAVYFRRSFDAPADRKIRRAIVLMGADARYELFVNGRSLIRGAAVEMPDLLEIAQEVRAGKNTVAVRAVGPQDPVRPATLIGVLWMEFERGDPITITTSDAWKTSAAGPENWERAAFDDSAWSAARDIGGYGIEPWGKVGFKEERMLPARMLRREFEVKPGLKRATAYVTGLGLSEFYLNGSKVGNHVLSPGLTDYGKRVLYVTYDVTGNIKQGRNTAGLILGNGRYWAPRTEAAITSVLFSYPKARCQIELEFADGTTRVVATDESWKLTRDGPIRGNNEYDGESYDARRELSGWAKAGYDDSRWEAVQTVDAPQGNVVAQMAEPIRVVDSIKPVKITEPRPGVFVFDMGQNMVGWCRLRVSGAKGTEVRLRHAETLDADGMLYLDNLRTARALDSYVLKGSGPEVWEPRFTYHGFRYVEMRGYPGKPPLSALEGRVVHDDMTRIADFRSSDEMLNKLHHNILWGVRGNYRSIPTDCPQRDERQGWLGDRSMVSRSESYLFDVAAFYTKWHHDLEDSQNEQGVIPDVSPAFWRIYSDDVTWPSTFILVPGMLFDQYGDRRVIQRAYPAMKKWIDHMRGGIQDDLLSKDTYGDWCVPPEDPKLIHSQDPARRTDKALIATAYFQYLLDLMARYATIAGHEEDGAAYQALAARMRAAFERKFYQSSQATYGNSSQTSMLLPLALGITSGEDRSKVMATLVRQIAQESNGHIGVGLIGAQWLMRTLSDYGQTDLAYEIATQKDYPGWGYMAGKGATTVWELWNGDTADPAMNSGNHVMQIGDLGIWMYAYLGGIRPDPEKPGFQRVVIRPVIPGVMRSAHVSHESMYGTIVSDWNRDGDRLTLHVTIPPNSTGLIHVPSKDGAVRESNVDAEKAAGIKLVRREGNLIVYEVGSGDYRFQSRF